MCVCPRPGVCVCVSVWDIKITRLLGLNVQLSGIMHSSLERLHTNPTTLVSSEPSPGGQRRESADGGEHIRGIAGTAIPKFKALNLAWLPHSLAAEHKGR